MNDFLVGVVSVHTPKAQIIRRIVESGNMDAELLSLTNYTGQNWERLPGESEGALIDRASSALTRCNRSVVRFIGNSVEHHHAST